MGPAGALDSPEDGTEGVCYVPFRAFISLALTSNPLRSLTENKSTHLRDVVPSGTESPAVSLLLLIAMPGA